MAVETEAPSPLPRRRSNPTSPRPSPLLLSLACFAIACSSPPPSSAPESFPTTPVALGNAETPPAAPACAAAARAPVFHRLSRTEYHNSVNQLLGLQLPLRERLPADPILFGFDNNAETSVSAPSLQRYLDLADRAVTAALAGTETRQRLVPCTPDHDGCLTRIVGTFAKRAWRRPVDAHEIQEQLALAATCGDDPLVQISCALQATLVAPDFLFRTELLAAPGAPSSLSATIEGRISPYALATRLSYFLVSSTPDDRLLELAADGRLSAPSVIETETNRLLDPGYRSRLHSPLPLSVPLQWLGLDEIDQAPFDSRALDADLRTAMVAESQRFFAEIIDENHSVLDLVKAPFTFVNRRLADHYGLSGVTGTDLRRVDTTGSLRGGVLTQGAFLTTTSLPDKPSISRRARWVLQNLLCSPLDDPPPGAEEMVPAPDPGLGLTSRQSLEQRTSRPPCSGCHALLNPIGFGLESFDAVGSLRTHEGSQPIDASGVLPTGERFGNTAEMLALLRSDPRFPTCLTRKLLTYALGRGLAGPCDDEAIAVLSRAFALDGYRLKNHIVRITRSELFRTARLAREVAP